MSTAVKIEQYLQFVEHQISFWTVEY